MVHLVRINGKYCRLPAKLVVEAVKTSCLMYPIDRWKVKEVRKLNSTEFDNFMSPEKNVEGVEGAVYDDQRPKFFGKGVLNRCSDYVGDELAKSIWHWSNLQWFSLETKLKEGKINIYPANQNLSIDVCPTFLASNWSPNKTHCEELLLLFFTLQR